MDATGDTRQTGLIELYADSCRREFYERNPEAVDNDVRLDRCCLLLDMAPQRLPLGLQELFIRWAIRSAARPGSPYTAWPVTARPPP